MSGVPPLKRAWTKLLPEFTSNPIKNVTVDVHTETLPNSSSIQPVIETHAESVTHKIVFLAGCSNFVKQKITVLQ